jgi:hypothetical protein
MPQSHGRWKDVSNTENKSSKSKEESTLNGIVKSLDGLISWLTGNDAVINKVVETHVPGTTS